MEEKEFYAVRQAILRRRFSRMNDRQREAVFHTEGPLLILAGAGSGKTTVLVNRIANLVQYGQGFHAQNGVPMMTAEQEKALRDCAEGVLAPTEEIHSLLADNPCPAWRILAITFTNKAAGELKERLVRMLGSQGEEVVAGTFHSFCARILRQEGERLGYSRHFTIYDTDDSRRLMKTVMKELDIDEKTLGHKAILNEIGRAKDNLLDARRYSENGANDYDSRHRTVSRAYAVYEKRLKEADAMDFDDLIFQTVTLLQTCPDVRERYQKRFSYIMVDEYQDTNHAQYELVHLLAEQSRNLCVVGDDDQSIYQFRGATIENILNFEDEFAPCKVIRLEQNYRSTKRILQAANEVIAKNVGRKGKTLWTQNAEGDKLRLVTVDTAEEEGRYIAETVLNAVAQGKRFSDHAVLYRANAQSNAIENALLRSGVPYRVIGGHRFNDTLEIKDIMAYLRLIQNPGDEVSLRRIINQPKRGIGDTTVDNAATIAAGLGETLYSVLCHAGDYPAISRSASKIKAFTDMMEDLRALAETGEYGLNLLYQTVLERTGYRQMWVNAGEEEIHRVENLEELSSTIQEYENRCGDEEATLGGFLEEQALMTDIDNYDGEADAVVLMTMHAAKGLEFPTVFLPGFENGIFPGYQSLFEPGQMEEDRRLCYVAITRAKEQLYICHAKSRMLYGQTGYNPLSSFAEDISEDLTEKINKCRPMPTYFDGIGRSGYGGGKPSFGEQSGRITHSHSAFREPLSGQNRATVGQPKATASGIVWQVGEKVHHGTFGDGEIVATTPMAGDTMLTIRFSAGEKKLMANFAKLQKI